MTLFELDCKVFLYDTMTTIRHLTLLNRCVEQGAALASSSRFIAQTPFFLYKGLISAYFLFWCVRWPFQYTAIYLFVTYWAWYMGALCKYSTAGVASDMDYCPRTFRLLVAFSSVANQSYDGYCAIICLCHRLCAYRHNVIQTYAASELSLYFCTAIL